MLSTIYGTSITNNNTTALVEKSKTRLCNRETATGDRGFNHGRGF